MTTDYLEILRQMKSKRPFVPFWIRTSDGQKYLVEDRFQFAIGLTKMMYAFPNSDRTLEIAEEKIEGVDSVQQKPAA